MHARIAVGLLASIVLLNGCAKPATTLLEQDRSSADLAKDQAECAAEATQSTDRAGAVGRGLRTTLVASVAGAIAGAGVGALLGVSAAAGASSQDPKEVGLIIGGGAAAGAVIGWFVGTGLGVRESAREAQAHVDRAFQRCMEERGYKLGSQRLER